jgi:metallophosphoesterase superfamily enzyme
MSAAYPVRLAGEELWLLPEKALYWPAQQALLIADVHFGKAAAYRSLGQPVPQGTTTANIEVLDRLLARLPCRQLIFLGDFLHGPGSHAPGHAECLGRMARTACGSADDTDSRQPLTNAGDAAALNIRVVPEPLLLGPFALRNTNPTRIPNGTGRACASAYRLNGKGRQRLRLACFRLGERLSLLPAFGAFTGGFAVEKDGSAGFSSSATTKYGQSAEVQGTPQPTGHSQRSSGSGHWRGWRLVRQRRLARFGRLFVGSIGIRLTGNAASHMESRVCQQ